jgi:predicted transcriptional regulator
MPSDSRPQLTLNFEPGLPDLFPTLRGYVAYRIQEQRLNAAALAGKMDLSPSVLSRKLSQNEGDTQRLNCDDLEAYIKSTGDAVSVIEYLAAKYIDKPEQRRARLLDRVEQLLPDLVAAVAALHQQEGGAGTAARRDRHVARAGR